MTTLTFNTRKVPRSQFDESYQDQQKVRRRLVRHYNDKGRSDV